MIKKPNILFITTDQQRKDTLGCYDNSLIKTPNLDRLASEGMVFDRAYCQSPICIPSRNTMITGKTAKNHGAGLHNSSLRDDELTIGDVLKDNGYDTYFVGKPHFKTQQHRGSQESIADWRDGLLDKWSGPFLGFDKIDLILGHSNPLTGHYGLWMKEKYPNARITYMDKELESIDVTCGQGTYNNHIPEESFSSTYLGDKVVDYLEKMSNEDKPFYCFASFPDPHWPIMPPKEFFEMYDEIDVPEAIPYNDEAENESYPKEFRVLKAIMEGKSELHGVPFDGGSHYIKNVSDIPKILRAYWGAISLIDKNVGRMLDKLNELGMAEDTIIVFTTDHGEYMGDHGMMAKGGFLWENLVNVPFIVKSPRSKMTGNRTSALFSFTDIVPTLLDLAGVKGHDMAIDGISQKDVINGEVESKRSLVTVHHPTNVEQDKYSFTYQDSELYDAKIEADLHSIITQRWKLVYYAGQKEGLLFDLESDPQELNNLYNDEVYLNIQCQLEKRLLDELIFENDKQALVNKRNADYYHTHLMTYDMWKPEFDAIIKEELI